MSKLDFSAVINFWFEQSSPQDWFKKSVQYDEKIRRQFSDLYWMATRCELSDWRDVPEGRLAEIIVLDQFSRNMFRESAQAFAFDSLAVALAQEAIRVSADQSLTIKQRKFLYMPLMHSESALIHHLAVKVFSQPGLEENYEYELKHKKIIDRFGRYPHEIL